jgi:ppGpp synthetase/RelA/SpoT-type nucleotidyltranferase
MPETSLKDRYEGRKHLLREVKQSLEEETKYSLEGIEHIDRISFRVKGTDSFVEKAEDPHNDPLYSEPLVEIEDQIAGRVIVFFVRDLAVVREKLKKTFNAIEHSERRPARDAEFGYESDHFICVIPPHAKPDGWDQRDDVPTTFELQVRTIFMHAYAEPQHDLAYKGEKDLPKSIRRELAWIAASAWGADQAYERVIDWHEQANEDGSADAT